MSDSQLDLGDLTAARLTRPRALADDSCPSDPPAARLTRPSALAEHDATTERPRRHAPDASSLPRFAVLDLDRDGWRLHDGGDTVRLSDQSVLRADFGCQLVVVEATHLMPQSEFSVSAPFTAEQLATFADNIAAAGVEIRTVPHRRTPRIWSEVEPDVPWDERDKERDTEVWHRYLSQGERLMKAKRWRIDAPAVPAWLIELRISIMRDVNFARQCRQYPKLPIARALAESIDRAKGWAWGARSAEQAAAFAALKIGSRTTALDSAYLCDAYCVARDGDGNPRQLSGRVIRHVCGLNFNGYPSLVRSDLRYHMRRARPDLRPTQTDKAFVVVTLALNRCERPQ